MSTHQAAIPAPTPVTVPGPNPISVVKACFATIATWHCRWIERRKLEDLSDNTLRDVGLSRAVVLNEARKPFWQR
jgi:uncharacterized protein YjiS (DUF1127 family)